MSKKLDFSTLSKKQIVEELQNNKKELMSLRFKHKLSELDDTSLFKKSRKLVAKLNTELNKRIKSGDKDA